VTPVMWVPIGIDVTNVFSSTAIEIINRLKFAVVKAKVFPHLKAWVCVGHGIQHVEGHNSVLRLCYLIE
jgi:hypothetical protein